MNLIEIRKQANMNKAISLIISILLVFSLFMAGTIQSEALAPVIVYSGLAVAAALLIAFGYSYLTSNDVNAAWSSMGQDLKDGLTEAGKNFRQSAQNFGIARGVISAYLYDKFTNWFNTEASDGIIRDLVDFSNYKTSTKYPAVIPYQTVDLTSYAVDLAHESEYSYQVIIMHAEGAFVDYYESNDLTVYESNSPFYIDLSSTGYYRLRNSATAVRTEVKREDDTIVTNVTNISPSSNLESFRLAQNTRYYYSNTPITYTVDGVIAGIMFYGDVNEYVYNSVYNPADNPLPVDSAGNREIQMPYTDNPDTNVAIPENNSISNPVSLETVIAGYGSMQDFFDAGGRIELADGTVIYGGSGINDLTRSGADVLPDTGTGAIESDVSGIKSLVNKLLGVITGIASAISAGFSSLISALSNPFDWSNKSPSGPGFISGLWAFFAVLLALLIAIMGLIAKVIMFIGQLYTIPASSAMLHPTMVQGIEWARGFDSQTGVNLYSLITGVISIVLGVVCFKLLRKIITGIGTAR